MIDNVATVPRAERRAQALASAQALELLDKVGLDRSLADRYPSQLSGGQQQRVGVARGLAVDPNILLMDEPFGAVDPIVRADLQRELLRLQRELDKTVVFVTHDIDEAFLLGDQVVILQKGAHIAQVGHPRDILANPANDFVAEFIGAARGKRRLSIDPRRGLPVTTTCWWMRQDTPPGSSARPAEWSPPRRNPAASRTRQTKPATPDAVAMDNLGLVLGLSLDHVRLSAPPIIIGFLACIPLGVLAHRFRPARTMLLTLGGVLFTIPSQPRVQRRDVGGVAEQALVDGVLVDRPVGMPRPPYWRWSS